MLDITDEQIGKLLADSVEDSSAPNQYAGSYHRGEGEFSILDGTLLIGAGGYDTCYGVPFSIKKLRENLKEAGTFLPPDLTNDSKALIEVVAQQMAESVGLLWEKLPDEPDMVCSHNMPEGCKRYWRDLAKLANELFSKQQQV